jgi:hypothetical protein
MAKTAVDLVHCTCKRCFKLQFEEDVSFTATKLVIREYMVTKN